MSSFAQRGEDSLSRSGGPSFSEAMTSSPWARFSSFAASASRAAANIGENLGKKIEAASEKAAASLKSLDLDLPLGSQVHQNSLADLDDAITYVTPRLVAMKYPTKRRRDAMARKLNEAHAGNFMVWNLSEKSTYSAKIFEGFVHNISFPGHPAPPLAAIVSICTSAASWLASDDRNVAVVHCMTGRGRTAVALSCLIAWMREASTSMDALAKVSAALNIHMNEATIPSQRRYIKYFDCILEGVKPRHAPVRLRAFSVSGIPEFQAGGCRPYLQAFVNGKLVYTCASHADASDKSPAACLSASQDSFEFQIDWVLRGDVLLR